VSNIISIIVYTESTRSSTGIRKVLRPPGTADLMATYPEVNVVLVERDINDWYCSFNSAVIEPSWSPFLNFPGDWDPWLIGTVRTCHLRWIEGCLMAHSEEEMQAVARRMYWEPYKFVRRMPPRRGC